jgi:hypothetical protein
MKTKDISEAKDPDLRNSLVALQRAALLARQTAIQTGTDFIVVRNGQLLRISAEQLRLEAESTTAPTLPAL